MTTTLPSRTVQSVDQVIITSELENRPSRPPDHAAENRAILALTQELTRDPQSVLQRTAEVLLDLCKVDSSGVSILEGDGPSALFRWHAAAGTFSPYLMGSIPQNESPCGTVMERKEILLFSGAARFYPEVAKMEPEVVECLIAPWEVDGVIRGTLWAVSHKHERRFDKEDARVLVNLSRFAAGAWGLVKRSQMTNELQRERQAALNLMDDAISARHEAEQVSEALVATQEQLRLIVESALEHAIISLDFDRRVTSWNPGAVAIFGFSPEEIIGEFADVIFTPEARAEGVPEREVETALEKGRAGDDRWMLRKDGSRFFANGAMLPMRARADGEVTGFVKILRDETKAVESKQALEHHRQQLMEALRENEKVRAEVEAASAAKDQFLAMLSHELRTPLTPVFTGTRILERIPNLPDLARETIAMIRRNLTVEAQFIDALLDVTRIGSGKFQIVREPLDVHETVRRAIEVSEQDFHDKSLRLTVSLAAGRHALHGDQARLQQAFWNLLKNAAKFTPDGGEIHVKAWNDGDALLVSISDTGIGIEPEAMGGIFTAFAQAGEEITRTYGGLGLGLTIAKAAIEAHDGSIEVSSEGAGKGATFTVRLPLESLPGV